MTRDPDNADLALCAVALALTVAALTGDVPPYVLSVPAAALALIMLGRAVRRELNGTVR